MSGTEPDFQEFADQEACPPDSLGGNGRQLLIPLLPTLDFRPDPQLEAEGWTRRFMADPDQIEEKIQLYNDLGFEVRIERIKPTELHDVCGACRLATCTAYVTLYTRKLSAD